ncbi:hypothetical protein DNTS_016416 [Danionella cerebrum]|uniref:TRPM SLOG domain-containing protein n=1 Tax=Danionella cerebrum TaxID=2873325 RepID=A0A553QUB2_9TELE|nr:hypothetical protein DNTS_016416 [Danionella translucida]
MLENQDTPLGVLRQARRCPRCGELLNSSPIGCRCYSTITQSVVSMVEKIAVGSNNPQGKGVRLGDIDFVGVSRTKGKFFRVTSSTDPADIYQMLTKQWGLAPPHLVVALMGGDEVSQLKPWLRDTLRKGLVKAAQSTGAWILTSGLRFGITKNLGQAVRDHSLASTSSKVRVVAIGFAPWNMIQKRELLLSAKPDRPVEYPTEDLPHGAVYSLDCNHSHFILVDEDPQRPGATGEMRVKMLKHISLQRTGYGGTGSIEIPVLCLLVHGEPRILQNMYKNIQNSIPWLILAGSGGVADILVTLMDRGCWDDDMVHELLNTTFTDGLHSTEINSWVKLIQRILDHGHLLTVHDPEQDSELDTVILKALVKDFTYSSKVVLSPKLLHWIVDFHKALSEAHFYFPLEAQDFLDELKLAVAWNRVDIAKSEIFSGDVQWSAQDLEEVMMEALVNDKPDFVRLFVDNGVNIKEFLTFGRLQELYCSVSEKNLLHTLLLKRHQALATNRMSAHPHSEAGDRRPRFTFHEVSKVLKDFLDDTCKGFYQKLPAERMGKGRLFHSQKNLPDMDRRCEHPWRDLFIWALLQNRQEMANYFWAMGPEAVAAALVGCKIMKEMAHLATEAESARSMKNAKYEQFAMATVLNVATMADAKCFFAHDGVQALLTKVWWGAMRTDTSISRLVLTFFLPPLVWTNLIKFNADEQLSKVDGEPFSEMEGLATEQTLLVTDEDPVAGEEISDPVARHCSTSLIRVVLQRWNRFWSAPVTVFMGNVIMYFAFLILFSYVLLLDFRPPPPHGPSAAEIILYFWVFTLVLEEIRQSFFTDEDMSILKKMKLYVEDNWNKCDMVAICLFVVGLSCRMDVSTYEAGRTVLALDFMVFTLRLIHIFAIHKQLGPKIIIVERMIKDVFFFLFFLSVWLIAYGVTTQALLHPNDPRIDWVFRRALYRPYLHIFGQIPLEEIDDVQEIISGILPPCPNVYANWLVILLLVIYLLVTNVLLLNLLIAMFSYTFQVVQENADIFWKFQRYNLIVEYHSRPALAPPFIIISHISEVLLTLIKKTESTQDLLERELPAGLDQKLMTWETVQKENYLAKLEHEHRESSAERLRCTSAKELPAGLDQKLMTWETVQKENYLAKLEHEHRESSAERLRCTSAK